jgi:uncharacterized protein YndB with AHSA1/START domain
MSELDTAQSITIEAPIDRVWAAVTTPELIKQWFFGVETETDWKVGSPLVHRGEYQGKPYEDKGEIVRFEPPTLLVHTHWSDQSGKPDRPENYQEVSWALSGDDGVTDLTITERNLPSEDAKKVSDQSWRMVLQNLKDLLEDERQAATA